MPAEPNAEVDGAGRTPFRGILSLQPAPLLNFIVRVRHDVADVAVMPSSECASAWEGPQEVPASEVSCGMVVLALQGGPVNRPGYYAGTKVPHTSLTRQRRTQWRFLRWRVRLVCGTFVPA